MATKSFIISSSGLKNILFPQDRINDFVFVFGKEEFRMNNFYAEFISPLVSRIHQADPTINTLNFDEIIKPTSNQISKPFLTEDTITLLIQISSGFPIEISEEQSIKMRLLSLALGNNELYNKLNELFPPIFSEENINSYLKNIDFLHHFSSLNTDFDFSIAIKFISSHFYLVDQDDFMKLPREIQYKIISHPDLQIESEDSLFEIISKIVGNEKEEDIDDVLFLEQIELTGLSENKFCEFIDAFDINKLSGQLWRNLCKCFKYTNNKVTKTRSSKNTATCKCKSILVCGYNGFNELGETPNNTNRNGNPSIYPAVELHSIDPSSLLSYSIYSNHSVLVTSNGSLMGVGNNKDGQISDFLPKTVIKQFTEFSIKDKNGCYLSAVSAVCNGYGTLYMVSKSSDSREKQLVLCDIDIKRGKPIFIDSGKHNPVALFGGFNHSAAIGSEGEIIFINRNLIIESPKACIAAAFLPDGEKASFVACCNDIVFVLSSNGRVFKANIEDQSSMLIFSAVSELEGIEIVCLSGTYRHCIAVSKEGRVFGHGSNNYGKLGLGNGVESISSFTEISSLRNYEIIAAYAGFWHSFFKTKQGKILSCGRNFSGELLLSCGPSNDVYLPTETTITGDIAFCIAGGGHDVVFFGDDQPPNTPNIRIQI